MSVEASPEQHQYDSSSWLIRALLAQFLAAQDALLGHEASRAQCREMTLALVRRIRQQQGALQTSQAVPPAAQLAALLTEVNTQLNLPYTIESIDEREITLAAARCPWEHIPAANSESLCQITRHLLGGLVAGHTGYAEAIQGECARGETGRCRMRLHLQPAEGSPSRDAITQEDLSGTPEKHANCLEHVVDLEQTVAQQLQTINQLKQDFLANISHELRTPITAMQGYLSIVAQGMLGPLTTEQDDALQIALRNLDRLSRLVNGLLDLSSAMRGELLLEEEPVSIADILARSAQRVLPQAKLKGIRLEREFPLYLGTVKGDRQRLLQLVEHLLENAIKFSESGHRVTLSGRREGQHAVLMVRDTGIGMTPKQLRHAFTPFVQGESGLTRRYEGVGMGLTLIKHLVTLHGGEISLESEAGKGTCVTITLPVLDEDNAAAL